MNRIHAQWTAFGIVVAILLAAGGYTIGKWNNPVPQSENTEDLTESSTEDPEEYTYGIVGDISFNKPRTLRSSEVFGSVASQIESKFNQQYGNIAPEGDKSSTWELFEGINKLYEVGTFKGTASLFKNQKLLLLKSECDGPCFYPMIYRFTWNPQTDELTYLSSLSSAWVPEYLEPLTKNKSNAVLQEVALPAQIGLPANLQDKKGVLVRSEGDDFVDRFLMDDEARKTYKVVFTDPVYGPVYSADNKSSAFEGNSSCFYVQAQDGTVGRFELKSFDFQDSLKLPDNRWISLSEYRFLARGCGIIGNCYTVEDVNASDLQILGTTEKGYTLYKVASPNVNAVTRDPSYTYGFVPKPVEGFSSTQVKLAEIYHQYKALRESTMELIENTEPPMSWEEYLAKEPLLYFKDAFGRFGAVAHQDFAPVAECGKPVIYLYPTEEMEVNVQVDVDEFTKTVPEYGEKGWTVKATPKGKLTNLADGQTYPYLFWEAKDDDAVSADRGFMVERKKVNRFLKKALKQMGFTRKEMKDFMEFWKPRILDNPEPYFFISFLGTQDFNKVAPLTITPQPDTLIRVFMYYDPVKTPFDVIEQKLSSTPRRGFTVFEWGGTSSRPWEEEE